MTAREERSAATSSVSEHEKALVQIAHVLGGAANPEPSKWKCGNNCEGCRHEMAEASRLALNALGFETYTEMLDAFGIGRSGDADA